MVISDAYVLSEMDDANMTAQLAGLQRLSGDTTKVAEQLRSVCLSMLCAAMQWDDFRSALPHLVVAHNIKELSMGSITFPGWPQCFCLVRRQ